MTDTLLYVTRHGQTDANLQKRVQGQGDTPLNTTGIGQARELARFFSDHAIDRIICSDLLRARQTARVLVDCLGVPASFHAQLRARRMGDFEGRTHEELIAMDAEAFRRLKHDPEFTPPGGGESVTELRARAMPFIRDLTRRFPGEKLAILSHHKVCQLIIAELAGGEMRPIANARPALVRHRAGNFTLIEEAARYGAA